MRRPTLLVGRDTRLSGEMLESALVAGVCSVGARAVLVEVLPTPAMYCALKRLSAQTPRWAGLKAELAH